MEVLNPVMEAVTERRQIKTHLRLDAMEYNPKVKYIYIARDGRDSFMSLYNHYHKGSDLLYQLINESPGEIVTWLLHTIYILWPNQSSACTFHV